MKLKHYLWAVLCSGFPLYSVAQPANTVSNENSEFVPFGNMDKWMVRVVNESFVIGGNTKFLYEIAEGDTLKDNTPYKNTTSPWGTSTVMAKVSGIYKASVTIFPEKRDSG